MNQEKDVMKDAQELQAIKKIIFVLLIVIYAKKIVSIKIALLDVKENATNHQVIRKRKIIYVNISLSSIFAIKNVIYMKKLEMDFAINFVVKYLVNILFIYAIQI